MALRVKGQVIALIVTYIFIFNSPYRQQTTMTTIQYNTKTRKASTDYRQNEQTSNVTSLQGQSRKFEQEIIDRVIFYEKSLSLISNYGVYSQQMTSISDYQLLYNFCMVRRTDTRATGRKFVIRSANSHLYPAVRAKVETSGTATVPSLGKCVGHSNSATLVSLSVDKDTKLCPMRGLRHSRALPCWRT